MIPAELVPGGLVGASIGPGGVKTRANKCRLDVPSSTMTIASAATTTTTTMQLRGWVISVFISGPRFVATCKPPKPPWPDPPIGPGPAGPQMAPPGPDAPRALNPAQRLQSVASHLSPAHPDQVKSGPSATSSCAPGDQVQLPLDASLRPPVSTPVR